MSTLDIIVETLAEFKGEPVGLVREQFRQEILPRLKDGGAGLLTELSPERAEKLRAICREERAGILNWLMAGAERSRKEPPEPRRAN